MESCISFFPEGAAFPHLKTNFKTLQEVQAILQKLPDSEKKLFRIVTPEEMKKIGADPNAVLAITPIEGVTINCGCRCRAARAVKGRHTRILS